MKQNTLPAFPKEGLQFLRSLKRNNNRDWFYKHKSIYETQVKLPMEGLIRALAREFEEFAPEMAASPKVSAYRIYRDTRFSKDKSPYKTHVAAVFPHSSLGKHEGAGFYVHIGATEVFIGGGLYMPLPEDLNTVRTHIAEHSGAFMRIVTGRQFRALFGQVGGDRLTRVPRGFAPDHPAAEFLKHKQFLVSRTLSPEIASTPEFHKLIVKTFRTMLPFVRFLNEPLVRARRVKKRQEALLRS